MRIAFLTFFFCIVSLTSYASNILIPMDKTQKNHIKAYGITFWVLKNEIKTNWLLNYRGGSFLIQNSIDIEKECILRGVSYSIISDAEATNILEEIALPTKNMDNIVLEKSPKIAVYSPKNKRPWDDAVTLVFTYAEIDYDIIYDDEILQGDLIKYDWLHLHHEDFTGQYGKFYASYSNAKWYREQVKQYEATASKFGYSKVSKLKLAVVKKITSFMHSGGFVFTMCSGTDSFDIALAAQDTDICANMFDGDPPHRNAQKELDFSKTLAFKNFTLSQNPYEYEFSDIDVTNTRTVPQELDYFTLFEFSAKWDPVPTMLTQNHESLVKGFMGQTTAFKRNLIKPEVLILGENKKFNEVRYLHGKLGKGMWTFYGGHDPEDYRHLVGDPPTNLELYPNSPGYRLILNNVLFPAAKKKKEKT